MTDFVVSARMVADATGLVAGANQGKAALKGLGDSAREAGNSGRGLGQTSAEQSRQMRANADAINQVVRATNPAISSQTQLDAALRRVQTAYIQGRVGAETYARAQAIAARGSREFAASGRGVIASAGQMRAGTMMLGQQIQDVGMQLALGTDFLRVFAMQAGQTALAVQQMTGRTTGFAAFIGGPWGSAILAGVSVLAILVSGLFGASSATDANAASQRQAITAADALGQAQGALGQMYDLATGKIRDNTEALRANAIMIALNLRAQAAQQVSRAAFLSSLGEEASAIFGGLSPQQLAAAQALNPAATGQFQNVRQIAINAGLVPGRRTAEISRAEAMRQLGLADTSALPISGRAIAGVLNERVQGEEAQRIADELLESLRPGGTLSDRFRRGGGGGDRRGRQRRATDQTEFGEDAADRIRDLTQQFSNTPPQVEAVRRAMADLDDIASDIERRRPPNYEALLAQLAAARPAIEDGINKPYRDFIQSQEESLRILALQARGRDDEATALQQILQLEQQRGPLSAEQRDQILANVAAIREQQRAVEILHQRQQLYLNALGETRKAITATVQGVLGGDVGALADLPRQMLQSFNRLTAERFVEMTFGPAFRQLEDEITGRNRVRQANEQLAASTDTAARATEGSTTATREATSALAGFTDALGRAATAATRPPLTGAEQNLANWNGGAATGWTGANHESLFAGDAGGASPDAGQDVVVTAVRSPLFTNPRQFFQNMVQGLLQGILGEQLARILSGAISRGLEGAAIGGMVGGALRALGLKSSGTGGQLGGAVGGILGGEFLGGIGKMLGIGGGPLGSILGGLAGSLIGGLLAGSKRGSATITSVDGDASTRGNSSDFIGQASSMATGIQSGLQQIADQLGGQLGSFAVSIGVRDGKFRVDPTGQGRTKTKKGAIDFGDDEAAAIMYAIMDAIQDGAVTGLSEAVQRALRSSSDIDKALREALKVDEIETLLEGPIGAMGKQLRDFERQAAERVRIAAKYGFDVLEIEKINAAERLKLEEQILESRIGSLQQLLDDLNFGDLFEGTISDQVARLREQLASAQADAEAGVEGAADRQADLSRSLIALLHEGFGTAGAEYAAGLDQVRSGAERVIELENQRLQEAKDAAAQTNAQLNENNDQNAQMISQNGQMITQLASIEQLLASGATPASIDVYRATTFE